MQPNSSQVLPKVYSAPEGAPPSPSPKSYGLMLRLISQQQLLLPTQYLTEIISVSVDQVVPVAEVPMQVMGVTNYRGMVLWLLDLGYLLGQTPLFTKGSRIHHLSVTVVEHQQESLGLVVDQVQQLLPYAPSALLQPQRAQFSHRVSLETASKSALPPYILGYWQQDQAATLPVLDLPALFDRLRRSGPSPINLA
jgi:positive phototaxis protein PixI